MSNIRRAAACAATAIGIGLAGTAVTAAPAFAAGSGHYINFANEGGFVVNTCYKWKGSQTADTCDSGKPITSTWRVEIPDDATGVELNVNVLAQAGGKNLSPQITDLKRDYCYTLYGTTFTAKIVEKTC
ncbi:hypothetical protein AB0B21_06495 [Streptomyces rimosus]|uniref:hypothetical protein n=1 Tax=Streptomyces rimosus TaxID=1927 RepID=UPI00051849BD|nr:hypothetical protein [Streptomyces rimosus]